MTGASAAPTTDAAPLPSYVFKVAAEPWEIDQIHRLNHRTFVEEIPQHASNPDGVLVDKFHAENTYLICLHGTELVGMIAVRATRPFSLDQKLPDLDDLLPVSRGICEYRLLSVASGHRKGRVFVGLLAEVARYCIGQGYDLAIISGTTRQAKLYRHLGFEPFGPLVGTGDVLFQPMYLTLDTAEQLSIRLLSEPWGPFGQGGAPSSLSNGVGAHPETVASEPPVNLLPGPVSLSATVRAAFAEEPLSHRSEQFASLFAETKARLRQMTGSSRVEIMMGSGTLANDVVGAQLSLLPGRGVVLANGEFGERLMDHASRLDLRFDAIQISWGDVFSLDDVADTLARSPDIGWLWAVHCETSTGVLNDVGAIRRLTATKGVRLCLDCISSIGASPVDLTGVYLASGVSGKGLAAFPGLSFVFSDHEVGLASSRIPRYLDLGAYAASDGVPYTISSNLVSALHAALGESATSERFVEIAALSARLRSGLTQAGFGLVSPSDHTAPAVLTIALPPQLESNAIGAALRDAGYLVSYQSRYLIDRNWIQICLMGADPCPERIAPIVDLLSRVVSAAVGTAGR